MSASSQATYLDENGNPISAVSQLDSGAFKVPHSTISTASRPAQSAQRTVRSHLQATDIPQPSSDLVLPTPINSFQRHICVNNTLPIHFLGIPPNQSPLLSAPERPIHLAQVPCQIVNEGMRAPRNLRRPVLFFNYSQTPQHKTLVSLPPLPFYRQLILHLLVPSKAACFWTRTC